MGEVPTKRRDYTKCVTQEKEVVVATDMGGCVEQAVSVGNFPTVLVEPRTRDITIRKVLNGYIGTVGCQTLVFNSKDEMLRELSRYLDNPKQVTEEYMKTYK